MATCRLTHIQTKKIIPKLKAPRPKFYCYKVLWSLAIFISVGKSAFVYLTREETIFDKKQTGFISNPYGNTIPCTKFSSLDAITTGFANKLYFTIFSFRKCPYCLQVIKLQGFLLPSGTNCLPLIHTNRERWVLSANWWRIIFPFIFLPQRGSQTSLSSGLLCIIENKLSVEYSMVLELSYYV